MSPTPKFTTAAAVVILIPLSHVALEQSNILNGDGMKSSLWYRQDCMATSVETANAAHAPQSL